jgi:excisionase family DNA binding protein
MQVLSKDVGQPKLITKAELARMLQLSQRTVYRMAQEKRLPAPIRLGSAIRWRQDTITEWIENDCQPVG